MREPAGRRTTMADVAAAAGVSRQTVSLVLGDKPGPGAGTRDHVLRIAEDLGYHADLAAQLLRRARSRQLGVLFTLGHALDPHVVEALYTAAARLDYGVVLSAILPSRTVRRTVDELLGLRCEALVLIGLAVEAPAHLAKVAERVPVVEIGQRTGADGIDSVRTDDDAGARLAVDHLAGLGHRDIAHVDGGTLPGAAARRDGYRAAMRAHGLAAHVRVLPGDYTEESGADAARRLLEDPRPPTAVLAGNDLCAAGFIGTALRSGFRVPQDLSVVGYDDSRVAGLPYVDLTTVRQDTATMADLAVETCAERLDGQRTTPSDRLLTPALAVRGSTAAPPAAGPLASSG